MTSFQYMITFLGLCIFIVTTMLYWDRHSREKCDFLKCELAPDLYLIFLCWIIEGNNNTPLCPFVYGLEFRYISEMREDGSELLRKILIRRYGTNYNPFRTSSERSRFVQEYMSAFKSQYPQEAERIREYIRNHPPF